MQDEELLPLYRAKKKNSNEYIEGYYAPLKPGEHYMYAIMKAPEGFDAIAYKWFEEIDIDTLAIHLPGMVDGKYTKIFASLSKTGLGGDIVQFGCGPELIMYISQGMCMTINTEYDNSRSAFGIYFKDIAVTGLNKVILN